MRINRHWHVAIPFVAFILIVGSPLVACLNDTAVSRGESEFRSRYESPTPQKQSLLHGINPWAVGAMALAGGCVGGSIGLARANRRRDKQ